MDSPFSDPAFWDRLQFGFTLTYHYLFPQLTMGLAWFLVYWKWQALRTGDEKYNQAVRFWARIFGLNFAVGVVTGIPMEFQFGTNWAGFTRYAGGVIGQTLAMEGMFAFLLESAFVGALVWGEKRLGPRLHFLAALAVATGSWLSGYFILVTNAFMQHPVGYDVAPDGTLAISSVSAYLLNPWVIVQFTHNQTAALVTGSFVIAAAGAFYALRGLHPAQARLFLRAGTTIGLIASLLVAFPTGDQQAKMVGSHQPVTLAAMEGKFQGSTLAGVSLIGEPDVKDQRIENPIEVPGTLSFLAYGTFQSYVHGLDEYPRDTWPDNIELLFYSFHVMITLGSIFIVLMAGASFEAWRGTLLARRWLLWMLMLAFPFPYIANTLGWMTAELGRQPWLIYGLFRTEQGYSKMVNNGETIFTLIGFTGLYFVLGCLFLFLVGREIAHGPDAEAEPIGGGTIPMIPSWYAIVSLTLTIYVVLDGRNCGAGMLHWLVAKTPEERRQVVAAIGPLWVWHEVWLVAFGGTTLAAFPKLLAVAFAGYYLALFLILWCLLLRGMALEVGGHIGDRMWQGFWDFVFVVSSFLLAVLFGIAAGNMARGVPLDAQGNFSMAFFTTFNIYGNVGLLDWYTLSVALFTVVLLAAHGATYLTLKTEGTVHDRCSVWMRLLWCVVVPLLLIISLETWFARPGLPNNIANPFVWIGLILVVGAAGAIVSGLRHKDEERTFLGSNLLLTGMLVTGSAAIFPVMLFSTLSPANSLTADAMAAGPGSLFMSSLWWPLAFVLALIYFVFISRRYRGKVSLQRDSQGYD